MISHPRIGQNNGLGIALMAATMLIFALQDGLSRHLASEYNTWLVVMYRFWFFALFVLAWTMRQRGGLRAAVQTRQPLVQTLRGVLLAAEICVMVVALTRLGLVESHAVFASCPLLVAALSGPVLGEKVGWRRWSAIGVGFVGMLIILQPGYAVFSANALIPLAAAFGFALYGLLTRYVARQDASAVSFFWTGVTGAVAITPFGLWHWQAMTAPDAAMMLALAGLACLGHYLLIKCYEVAEASAVQPFAYLQLAFVAILGLTFFGEQLRPNVAVGTVVVVAAGVFTLWRARLREKSVPLI